MNGIVQVLEGFVEAKDQLIEMDANPLGSERATAATFGCNGLQSSDAQSAEINLLPAALLGAFDADVDEPLTVAGESRRDQEREGFLFGHVVRVPQPGGTVKADKVATEMFFVWANEHGDGGMLPPEHWEALSYRRVRRHPFWAGAGAGRKLAHGSFQKQAVKLSRSSPKLPPKLARSGAELLSEAWQERSGASGGAAGPIQKEHDPWT